MTRAATLTGVGYAFLQEGTAQISWWATVGNNEPGTVEYREVGSPGFVTVSGVQGTDEHNGTFFFVQDLSWLGDFNLFQVVVSNTVSTPGSCAVSVSSASIVFQSPSSFGISARDLPYDSISQEGGGEELSWSLPWWFLHSSLFVGGDLEYYPDNQTNHPVHVPIDALPELVNVPGMFVENLSALNVTWTYDVLLLLNFTVTQGPVQVQITASGSTQFVYLADSSGDGLADSEKVLGWTVTYTDISGRSVSEQESADTELYATNNLTSDYVEKEFGLNPHLIDTAGGHMLDTWNLTFDLGPSATAQVPTSGFEMFFENQSYDPSQVAEFPMAQPPGSLTSDPGNFSGPSATGPDSSAWASTVLWSSTDLSYLQSLIASPREGDGWMRAVMGHYGGDATLTVWGKLSWGANPLAASTPSDHIPDGARLNPLHEEYLQLYVPSASYTYDATQCLSVPSQSGYGVRFYVNESSVGSGPTEFQGFSTQGFGGDYASRGLCLSSAGLPTAVQDYFMVAPVNQGAQFQHVDVQLVENTSLCSSGCPKDPHQEQIPIAPQQGNSCGDTVSMSVDMFSPPYAPFQSGSSVPITSHGSTQCLNDPTYTNGGTKYYLFGSIQAGATAVAGGTKAPTYLFVPSDNSTLSNLPLGLKRYTGEQDFVLLAVNFTTPDQGPCHCKPAVSDPIPNPWGDPAYVQQTGNQYTISAGQGMINILVPRGQFLESPMGQAILLNRTVPMSNVQGYPLLGTSQVAEANGAIQGGTGGATLGQLECYWQDRATEPGGFLNGTTPCSLNGGSISGIGDLGVAADTENCAAPTASVNCAAGGVPSNPSLEAQAPAPAVQSIVMFNSPVIYPFPWNANDHSDRYALDALIAGLLDNSTGCANCLNGTLQDVTNYLPSLGLNAAVLKVLANATWNVSGIYTQPVPYAQPAPAGVAVALMDAVGTVRPAFSFGSSLWNSVSGTITGAFQTAYRGLQGIAGAIWSAGAAALQYVDQIGHALVSFAIWFVVAVDRVLVKVGEVLEQALDQLAKEILALVSQALSAVVGAAGARFRSALSSWGAAWASTTTSVDSFYSSGSEMDASSSRTGMLQGLGSLFLVMAALAVALAIVTTAAAPLDIGADVIVPLLLTVVVTAFGIGQIMGALGLPGSLLSYTQGITFRYFSAVSELLFNITESPISLTSSDALAIAVPDGDPYAAWAVLFGGIGYFVGFFAGVEALIAASRSGTPGAGLAASFLASELSFAGLGVAIAAASDLSTLPSGCTTASQKVAYEGDQGLSAVSLGFAVPALLLLGFALLGPGARTLLTYLSLAVTVALVATSIASIVYVWHTCGTL